MKKIIILFALMAQQFCFCSFVFSQSRNTDISVHVTSNVINNVVPWGDTASYSFDLINNGTDSILPKDTITAELNFFSVPVIITDTIIAPGDSLSFNDVSDLWNTDSTSDYTISYCVSIQGFSQDIIDSDTSNNVSCLTDTFKKEENTGIYSLHQHNQKISLYPNPATNFVSISIPEINGNANLVILDINGRIIKKITINKPSVDINLSDFPNGIYVIKVQTPENVYTRKLSIIH